MLDQQQIKAAADALYTAEKTRQQIQPITLTYPNMDMDDAYAVQRAWVDKKISDDGAAITGYKIGLTSRAMQMAMNITTPDFGILLDDMHFPNNSDIPAADFLDPRIEVELGFVLKKPLFGESVTVDQVLDATDYIVPALELIAARSFRVDPQSGYTRTVFDTISDNAANAGYIEGDVRVAPGDIDLRWAGAICYLNGEVEETGLAAGVLDHPAKGICWVCKRFAPHGIGIEPGQFILAGSFTRPIAVKPGDKIVCDYGPLGVINAQFT
ncbi:2-oxo-hepta-3-ene-1,7-dioic acid hydratase [Luminiphilus syltensis NOR5-1B]|uniref:2-oxo-hepta-3-ene-1,7-dioic acid hydratase n=1 Tax=Luminiphilus syltensis NOR5-1B TaxID=565045 RepID=B8KTQ5_9GAMM|nr:2-oxo-hepta-3-ene-1,7-dioic acid hydratase [Luminiphilus syltensis]EED36611.1 2-oxo-hepta-3-ene-1,7-dioic acid hydratase [Luminiphilus syltensis NOR5-1B]